MSEQRQTYVLATGKTTARRCLPLGRWARNCISSFASLCATLRSCSGYFYLPNGVDDQSMYQWGVLYQSTSMDVGVCRNLSDTSDYIGGGDRTKENEDLQVPTTSYTSMDGSGVADLEDEHASSGLSKTTQLKFCVWEVNLEAGEYNLNLKGDEIVRHHGRIYPESSIATIYKKDCRSYLWKRSGKTTPGVLEDC